MATKTSNVTVEPIAGRYELGEGPHWDDKSQTLYFVDIFKQKIHRLDPATGSLTSTTVKNGPVGVVVPVADAPGKLIAGSSTEFVLVTWDGQKDECCTETLAKVDTDRVDTRWNDGKVDSRGRFWGGTMGLEKDGTFPPNKGTFYSIGSDFVPKTQISPVTISNGLAWNMEDDTFYYIDSPTHQVWAYNYDAKTGVLSNKRIIFDLVKNDVPGLPDGMTIDTDGNLWVALYGGGRVIQVNPKTGELLRTVLIPAQNVTSVAFGGKDLDTLYVTTATIGMTESQLKEQPHAGFLFAVNGLGVRGRPANSFKMNG